MRAVVMADFDTPPTVTDVPTPEPGPGEVRVRVHAASINGWDLGVIQGRYRGRFEHRFPATLGRDFAGVIHAVGPGVTQFKPGDRVFGAVTKEYVGGGSFAEYVVVPADRGIALLPRSISFNDGAAIGHTGAAAANAIDAAAISPGDVVLVTGATGGVGTQVVQLALRRGARVIATARDATSRAHLSGLGVNEFVDHARDLGDQVRSLTDGRGADIGFHLAGTPEATLAAIRQGGTFVSLIVYDASTLSAPGVTIVTLRVNPTKEILTGLAAEFEAGTMKAPHHEFPLTTFSKAMDEFRAGALGKIVLTVN